MKKLITTAAITLLMATTAHAADQESSAPKMGMMQGDMMKSCQSHMKDGKMMDNMPKDMMRQCQEMMQPGSAKTESSKTDDNVDHVKHHPAQ